jgi:HTH-type transcriptional regulator / antitoxin HigA
MITNDRQYRIVKAQIENFQETLESLTLNAEHIKDVHPKILEAERNAVNYQLQQLLVQVKEYEELKAGEIFITEVKDLHELPLVLIKSRIANGYTQADLAELLQMKEQQIQKYEAEQYENVSLKTLLKVADVLKININADVQIRQNDSKTRYSASDYPFKQMFQRKWFTDFRGTYNDAVKNSDVLIANLFQRAGTENLQYALNRRSIRTNTQFNQEALNVWYARVILKAREQHLSSFFDKNIITSAWLKELASYSIETNGPHKAVDFLKSNGIRVVFEPQMEGTYLDGAALLLDKTYPVIALTVRHDRIDNFWFVLFHELAHIILHLGEEYDTIFDDLDSNIDGIELEADEYALNISVPAEIWKKSLVRFSPSKETIVNQARTLKIHPALVAGRIRRETGKYHLYNDLIGLGEVRKLFNNELNN